MTGCAGPAGPAGAPVATSPLDSFEAVTAPFAMFSERTAPFLSWSEPTLRAGSFVTAYVVPPVATNRATSATTIAGDGRCASTRRHAEILWFPPDPAKATPFALSTDGGALRGSREAALYPSLIEARRAPRKMHANLARLSPPRYPRRRSR